MIKRLLTATTLLLLACSCNSSSTKSWRKENRLPDDVYRVEEVSVVNNPFGNDHKHTSRTVYSLDELGRIEYVTDDGYRTDYYYTGSNLSPDSCVSSDGRKVLYSYRGEKCTGIKETMPNGDINMNVHIEKHNRMGLPLDWTTKYGSVQFEYNDRGKLVSTKSILDGDTLSNMIYEYNSHGDKISERELVDPDRSTPYDYDYDYEGDFWSVQRKYKVYPTGDRDLRLVTTRKIFRK